MLSIKNIKNTLKQEKEEKEENKKKLLHFQQLHIFEDENTKILERDLESLEFWEIFSSDSEWKIDSDKIFVTHLNCESGTEIYNQIN